MYGKIVFLRAIEESDLQLIRQWNFTAEIKRFFSPRWPVNMQEQKKWFDDQNFSSNKKRLVICDLATSRPIGLIGIMSIDHLHKNCEAGITIGEQEFWGKQHAKEAMKLTLSFLFLQFNMHVVYLRVMQSNDRALRFFEKCGFVQNGILRDMIYMNGKYESWVWMSVTRQEFDNRGD